MELPVEFKLQYSAEAIRAEVRRMGGEITTWAEDVFERTGRDLLGIPVLRGGIFFFADLVREIKTSVAVAPVRTWAYESVENALQRDQVRVVMEDLSLPGRSVLLIDDICDTGRTLEVLSREIKAQGAADVRSAVLVKRVLERSTFEPDYVGLRYVGKEWFVGYGMEDRGRWRNLADIYLIQPR